jgi:hypothetical protein
MTQPPERPATPPNRSLPSWTAGQLLATWLAVPMIVINLLWGTLASLGLLLSPFAGMADYPFPADSQPRMILILTTDVGLPFLSAGCGVFLVATGWALGRPRRPIAAAAILSIPYVVLVVLTVVLSF